jgi:hypothetical protein
MTRRLLILTIGACLFTPVFAQEASVRFYVVPAEGGVDSPSRPKYFSGSGLTYSAIKYGPSNYLVGATLTQAQHDAIAANGDVVVIPPLESTVGGNPTLNQVRNQLEALSIPGSWIESTTTWRQVVKRTGNSALILGRMRGELGKHLFGPGVQLTTSLTTTLRDEFIQVATSLAASQGVPITTSSITTSISVQTALLTIGDQLKPFTLAGEIF